MSNVFGIQNNRQLEELIGLAGSIDECERLGFATQDENGAWQLTVSGFGYLLFVAASDENRSGLARKAFAAGYECAAENHIDHLDNQEE